MHLIIRGIKLYPIHFTKINHENAQFTVKPFPFTKILRTQFTVNYCNKRMHNSLLFQYQKLNNEMVDNLK